MRELRRNLVVSVILFLVTVCLYAVERIFIGFPGDRFVFGMAIMLSGSIAAAIYCTKMCMQALTLAHATAIEQQRAEHDRLVDRLTQENHRLVERVVTEFEGYGDRRAIDAVISAERRRVINERAGMSTIELGGFDGNNVTNLRHRHHRRNDAG